TQHFGVRDCRNVDRPPRIEGEARELGHRLALDFLERLARADEGEIGGCRGGACPRYRLLERPALEVMPQAPQARAPALEVGQPRGLFRRQPLRAAQALIGSLA